ncbi:hypothetical protein HA050_17385 [Iodobacter sp. HSC-16F04]|uniref:Uncharacterized protein n=1 Tax=Iodobacter violaceini TaxID=3044271 RepID=A0ABX0KZR3_9NEIS|nr:hypothetical protein [Iodobacter violacea]NHQ87885.1 hypothetical protein [Iodobacter violacea]
MVNILGVVAAPHVGRAIVHSYSVVAQASVADLLLNGVGLTFKFSRSLPFLDRTTLVQI